MESFLDEHCHLERNGPEIMTALHKNSFQLLVLLKLNVQEERPLLLWGDR